MQLTGNVPQGIQQLYHHGRRRNGLPLYGRVQGHRSTVTQIQQREPRSLRDSADDSLGKPICTGGQTDSRQLLRQRSSSNKFDVMPRECECASQMRKGGGEDTIASSLLPRLPLASPSTLSSFSF